MGSGAVGSIQGAVTALYAGGPRGLLEDGRLLEQYVRHQDEVAFRVLVERHGKMVRSICWSVLRDAHDTEDAFQATYLLLARKAPGLWVNESLGGWLHRVARRIAVEASRRKRQRSRLDRSRPVPAWSETREPDDWPRVLHEEIDRLPEKYRLPVILCDLQGLTREEAARRLGWPPGSVAGRQARARAMLRKRLTRRGLDSKTTGMPVALPAIHLPQASVNAAVRCALDPSAVPAAAQTLVERMFMAMRTTAIVRMVSASLALAMSVAAGIALAGTWRQEPPAPPAAPAAPKQNTAAVAPSAVPNVPEDQDAWGIVSEVERPSLAVTPAADRPNFEVLVLDKKTKQPVPGATVRVYTDPGEKWFKTGPDGIARGIQPATPTYRITIDAWSPTHQNTRRGWSNRKNSRLKPAQSRETIEVEPGELTVGGRVVDEAGKPIPGVKVELAGMREGEYWVQFFNFTAETDGEGRWSCAAMPRTLSKLMVQLYHPDFYQPLHFAGDTDRALTEAYKAGTRVDTLKRGIRLEGRVVDTEGKSIAGAILKWPNILGSSLGPEARTNHDGRFLFPAALEPEEAGKRPERTMLLTFAPGKAPDLRRISTTPALAPLEIRLEPGRVLRGRALDSMGKPVPGAMVVADIWNGRAMQESVALTGPDGRFVWQDAPPDPVKIYLSAWGYEGEPLTCSAGETEYVWTMKRILTVDLRVKDARTGRGVSRFDVGRGELNDKGEVAGWREPKPPWEHRSGWSGNADIRLGESAFGWKLRVEATGYRAQETRAITMDEEQARIDMELAPLTFGEGGGPSGVVVGGDGKPIAGAEVMLSSESEQATLQRRSWTGGQGWHFRGLGILISDSEGRFTFSPAPAHFVVGALHPSGYGEVSAEELARTGRIVLKPWGKVEGRVLVGKEPRAGVSVLVEDDVPFLRRARIHKSNAAITDADGRFVIEGVPPGPIVVSDQIGDSTHAIAYTDLEPAGTVTVRLGGQGRPVIGKVIGLGSDEETGLSVTLSLDREEYPYPIDLPRDRRAAWLEEWWFSAQGREYRHASMSVHTVPGPDGVFRFDDVPAGDWVVRMYFYRTENGQRKLVKFEQHFTVPRMPEGRSDEPLDLGELKLTPAP